MNEQQNESEQEKTNLLINETEIELKSNFPNEIEIILNEYNQSNERIETFINRQDSILQISLAIVGGAIAFTILNPIANELYIIIPLIPIFLFTHIAYHYTRVIANQGYREYLQNILNSKLPTNNNIKYSFISKEFLLNTNPIAKLNSFVFPAIVFVSIAFSIIMSDWNLLVIIGNIIIIIFILIGGLSLKKFTKNLNEKVKTFCEEN